MLTAAFTIRAAKPPGGAGVEVSRGFRLRGNGQRRWILRQPFGIGQVPQPQLCHGLLVSRTGAREATLVF